MIENDDGGKTDPDGGNEAEDETDPVDEKGNKARKLSKVA